MSDRLKAALAVRIVGAIVTEFGRRVGDQPDRHDVEIGVGGHERSGSQRDLLRVGLEGVEHGHLRDRLRVECLLKDRALGHGEPDPHADGDEQHAGQEWNPPSPLEELLVGQRCRQQGVRTRSEDEAGQARRLGARHRRSHAGARERARQPSAPHHPTRRRRRKP